MTVMFIKGPTIKTFGGRYFDLENPGAFAFNIVTVAHALSNICRFTGHCWDFYSVAQHSVIVSKIVPPEDALAGLLHDAAEAFIGDVSSPLKGLLPEYKIIERKVEAAVFSHFGLSPEIPFSVKVADTIALRTEQRDLMLADNDVWDYTKLAEPLEETIIPLPPKDARQLFLDRYMELTGVAL